MTSHRFCFAFSCSIYIYIFGLGTELWIISLSVVAYHGTLTILVCTVHATTVITASSHHHICKRFWLSRRIGHVVFTSRGELASYERTHAGDMIKCIPHSFMTACMSSTETYPSIDWSCSIVTSVSHHPPCVGYWCKTPGRGRHGMYHEPNIVLC